jgi:hypothetical protein
MSKPNPDPTSESKTTALLPQAGPVAAVTFGG